MKLVRDVLEFSGYEVIEATTGEDGVRLAETERPHLILMDLQLPGIDGAEALRQIRVGPRRPGCPGRGGHRLRDGRGQDPGVRLGVRRLPREAHRRAPLPAAGTRLPGSGRPTMTAADEKTRVLVVDDQPANVRLLEATLTPRGYDVRGAESGEEALAALAEGGTDLVLLDIVMPGIDGYEVCRRIRADPTMAFLPVVMVTASGDEQKIKALEAGADDFLTKPIDRSELLARVASLARIKRYQDTVTRQAGELAAWNRELEDRVQEQVGQLERMAKLRRFLSPQLAELIVDSGDESFLDSHRREIVVVFCDLRGFTPFAEASEPEEVMGVLADYHEALGDLIFRFEGTLERFAGDGLMVFFNDPVRCEDGPLRAIRMSVAMRDPGPGPRRDVEPAGPRPGARHRHRAGLRDPRQDRLRGQVRLRGHRQRHQPRVAVVLRRGAVADPHDRARLHDRRAGRGRRGHRRAPAPRLQPIGPSVRRQGPRHLPGGVMTGPLIDKESNVLSTLSEEDRYQRFDSLQSRMDDVWEAMRLNYDDESVVVVPSITLDRAVAGSGTMTQAYGGAVPVHADAAPPAPPAHDLRDLAADRTRDRGVLPRPPPRRHPEPRQGPPLARVGQRRLAPLAQREAARPSAGARPDRRTDPQPRQVAPRPLQHHRARTRRGAEPGHPDVRRRIPGWPTSGSKTGCRRLFGELGVPYPLGAEDLHGLDDIADAIVRDARRASVHAQCDRQAQRGCLGRGQCRRTPRGPPATGGARRAGRGAAPARGDGAGVREDAVRRLRREVRGGGRHRRGADRGR